MNALRFALLLGVSAAVPVSCGGVAERPHSPEPVAVRAPSFAHPVSYETGRDPADVAIADLNGDGQGDIVTTDSRAVSALLSDRKGSFGKRTDFQPGGSSLGVADLNHDGAADIVVAGHRKSVSVLFNRGNGTFRAGGAYETTGTPNAVAVGDLNGDGSADLAVANADGVSVLLNRGDGSFMSPTYYRAGDAPSSVAIADLNGDGKPDLATAAYEGSSALLLNRGDGKFGPGRHYDGTTGESLLVAADFNGDGKQDLAVATNDETGDFSDDEGGPTLYPSDVYVLPSKGDGRFGRPPIAYETQGYDEGLSGVAADDMNRDGRPDVVFAHWGAASAVSILLGSGQGRFEQVDYPVGDREYDFALAVGDVNGDARPDLVLADEQGRAVSVYVNTPGLCTVQDVTGMMLQSEPMTLPRATRALEQAHCRVGTIREQSDTDFPDGSVLEQKPRFGAVLPGGSKVDLVVSKAQK